MGGFIGFRVLRSSHMLIYLVNSFVQANQLRDICWERIFLCCNCKIKLLYDMHHIFACWHGTLLCIIDHVQIMLSKCIFQKKTKTKNIDQTLFSHLDLLKEHDKTMMHYTRMKNLLARSSSSQFLCSVHVQYSC